MTSPPVHAEQERIHQHIRRRTICDLMFSLKRFGPSAARITITIIATTVAAAHAADDGAGAGVGFDYSRGNYGEASATEILYLPVYLKYDAGPWAFKVTLPYLYVKAPANVVIADGRPVARAGGGARTSEQGLGDIVASAGYTAYESAASGIILDVIGKLKLPTADEDRGLGTGETDYSVQADGYKSLRSVSLLGTLGYRWIGSPEGVDLDNVWFGTLGAVRKINPQWSAGLLYDYREASSERGSPQSEATAFVSRRLDAQTKAQLYTVKGFSDGSPAWGAGAALTRSF